TIFTVVPLLLESRTSDSCFAPLVQQRLLSDCLRTRRSPGAGHLVRDKIRDRSNLYSTRTEFPAGWALGIHGQISCPCKTRDRNSQFLSPVSAASDEHRSSREFRAGSEAGAA